MKITIVKKNAKEKTKEAAPKAKDFIGALILFQNKAVVKNMERFFREGGDSENKFVGVQWGQVFKLAKEFQAMEKPEIEKLLDSKFYEARMGAVSIMDFKARNKKITEDQRKVLFDLFIKRHDRINNWDLVDRGAGQVVGAYLLDKPRTILYKLAKSKNIWERRTAIVATSFFLRKGESFDTFGIAKLLLKDEHDLIHKAVGSWIREAGKRDPANLIGFLNEHASDMPRVMLRYAIEKLDKKKRDFYLSKT
jgi:3-methyladenine DNA glycosylase AlkD